MTGIQRDKAVLGDSWVVPSSEDGDRDDDSYEEDADTEIHHDRSNMMQSYASERSRRQNGRAHGGSEVYPVVLPNQPVLASEPRRRVTRASSIEPEFIMPSIHEDGSPGPRRKSSSRRNSNIQGSPRKTRARTATSSRQDREGRMEKPVYREFIEAMDRRLPRDFRDSPVTNQWIAAARTICMVVFDIIGKALGVLKTPISYLIAFYLFLGLIAIARNILTNSVYTALSPICRIPGSSLLNLPFCSPAIPDAYKQASNADVEFDQLMSVQSKFEEVLEQSAAGVSLPLDMKRGETSIRDLRQIVRFSHLPSRNELVLEFDGFIETARMASYDLQKFNSHVGRGVDHVLATARWTRRVLNDIASTRASRGLIPAFINDKLLAPFQPVTVFTSETALLDQYIAHTRIVEEEINRLVSEAQALLHVLSNLEDRLEVIHSISLRDNIQAQGSKDEILSHLWTMLGGNRVALGKYNSQLYLLRHVGEYRKTAWAHVSGTILKLQAMGAELEELRERVGSAELLRDRAEEIPLSVHIENIELGVERLEQGRTNAKRVESEHLKRVLGRAEDGELRLVEA